MLEEVIECDIGNINIKHTDPVDFQVEIGLPMKDEKLGKLQECDPHIKHLRKQYTENRLDKNTYTMENNKNENEMKNSQQRALVHTNSCSRHPKRLFANSST